MQHERIEPRTSGFTSSRLLRRWWRECRWHLFHGRRQWLRLPLRAPAARPAPPAGQLHAVVALVGPLGVPRAHPAEDAGQQGEHQDRREHREERADGAVRLRRHGGARASGGTLVAVARRQKGRDRRRRHRRCCRHSSIQSKMLEQYVVRSVYSD
jgi:hypothetical protein